MGIFNSILNDSKFEINHLRGEISEDVFAYLEWNMAINKFFGVGNVLNLEISVCHENDEVFVQLFFVGWGLDLAEL